MEDYTSVPSLVDYLAQIPGYRRPRGRRHPLRPPLLLVCVAMRCGARAQSAMADWGRHFGRPRRRRLGFTRARGPSQPTVSRLSQGSAYATVEATLRQWAEQALRLCPPAAGELEGAAVDGKTLRGSKRRGAAGAPLLSASSHRLGAVLGQAGVPDKANELGAAAEFPLAVVLEGRVVTAEALLARRSLAQAILDRGGDYLLVVKEHQPAPHADIAATCAPAADDTGLVGTTREVVVHGGRLERRELTASTALAGYSDWPGLRQALQLERRAIHQRTGLVLRQETAYAVTALPPARATPAQLLRLWRQHWRIADQLHDARDATFDEDRARVRTQQAPQLMAAFRDTASGLQRRRGATNSAAACRRYMAQPAAALVAVGLPGLCIDPGWTGAKLSSGGGVATMRVGIAYMRVGRRVERPDRPTHGRRNVRHKEQRHGSGRLHPRRHRRDPRLLVAAGVQ
jgi:predicted transposase YbfD/YdcC